MKKVEATIQRALVQWIKLQYPFVKVIAAQNENSRYHIEQGMDKGLPDLMLMWRVDGVLQVLFLELKTKNGRLQQSQKDWATNYTEHYAASNTQYAVAYGFVEAQGIIQKGISSSKSKTGGSLGASDGASQM